MQRLVTIGGSVRAVTKLGQTIEEKGFPDIAGIHPEPILMPYTAEDKKAPEPVAAGV